MPKTKIQGIVYGVIMVILMVYTMVLYNIVMQTKEFTNMTFLIALMEFPLEAFIAFVVESLFVGNLAKKLAFRIVKPNDREIFIILAISIMTVCLMCPIMSLIAGNIIHFSGWSNFIPKYLSTVVINFPMALGYQLFIAGPLTRFIFRKIFKNY